MKDVMTWSQMLESIDEITTSINNQPDNIEDTPIEGNLANEMPTSEVDEEDLLNQLNTIFTPILVMQKFEGDVSDKIQDALSEAAVLTEKNIIKFDDATRMAQLISTCALLIARQKKSEKYQMYEKAAKLKNQMKLDIQKEEYDAAKSLAQKFLVKVSTTNNSPVARDAANDLLPETQH